MNITEVLYKSAEEEFKNYSYKRADERQDYLIQQLSSRLSDENLELLNEIIECACTMEYEHASDLFKIGLSLGVQLALFNKYIIE